MRCWGEHIAYSSPFRTIVQRLEKNIEHLNYHYTKELGMLKGNLMFPCWHYTIIDGNICYYILGIVFAYSLLFHQVAPERDTASTYMLLGGFGLCAECSEEVFGKYPSGRYYFEISVF